MNSRHGCGRVVRPVIVKAKKRIMTPQAAFAFNYEYGNAWINDGHIPGKVGDQEFCGCACHLQRICVMRAVRPAAVPSVDDIAMLRSVCDEPGMQRERTS
jgi:hypothetical protein